MTPDFSPQQLKNILTIFGNPSDSETAFDATVNYQKIVAATDEIPYRADVRFRLSMLNIGDRYTPSIMTGLQRRGM